MAPKWLGKNILGIWPSRIVRNRREKKSVNCLFILPTKSNVEYTEQRIVDEKKK
jgi:hypothetical protein